MMKGKWGKTYMTHYETITLQVTVAHSLLMAVLCLELRSLNPFLVVFLVCMCFVTSPVWKKNDLWCGQ